jgi:hypothetical protein
MYIKKICFTEDKDVDNELEFIDYTQNTVNYWLYKKLSKFEQHFDELSAKHTNIALTWLLGTYAGIGFLFSVNIKSLPFDHMICVVVISMFGFLGNSILWHLAVNIYTKFWAAVLIEEILMERKFPFLLNFKSISLLIVNHREKNFSHGLFYMVSNSLLVLTMGAAVTYFFVKINFFVACLIAIFFILLLVLTCFFMMRTSKKTKASFDAILNITNTGTR